MLGFIARRLVLAVPTLIGITLITFLLLNVAASDPALVQAGPKATKEVIEPTRIELGTNKPQIEQYVDFLKQTFTLDFGDSWKKKRPVKDLILPVLSEPKAELLQPERTSEDSPPAPRTVKQPPFTPSPSPREPCVRRGDGVAV